MDSRKLALLCRELADNKKAEDILILDVREVSSVTDYFVIASGSSEPHLRAIVDEIRDKLRDDYHVRPKAVDGTLHTAWVVSLEVFTISSKILMKSSSPGAGMMMVSRRPPTSSVMRRNRPRGFSFKENMKVFRSIWTLSDLSVSSFEGGLGPP